MPEYILLSMELFPSRSVAIEILGFSIYWYGLLYLAAFILSGFLLPRIQRLRNLSLSKDEWGSVLAWSVGGVLVGGRLGYVFFYRFADFLQNPLLLFDVRGGGMASHGGFIGVSLALLWVLRKRGWNEKLRIADVVVVPVAIGLALGRFGNFLNQELYGTVTTLPWGMEFPGADGPRHPTQLYAMAKDLLIAAICFSYLRSTASSFVAGRATALFLMFYGVLRFLVEFVRDQAGVAMWGPLSEGQVLTVPVFLAGGLLWLFLKKR